MIPLGLLTGMFLAVWQFMIAYVLVYAGQAMGATPIVIGLVGSMQSIGFIIGLRLFLPALRARYGAPRALLVISAVLAAIFFKLIFMAGNVYMLMLMYVLYNIAVSIFFVTSYDVISLYLPNDYWPSSISRFRSIIGAVMVVMVLIGAKLSAQPEMFRQTLFFTLLAVSAGTLIVLPSRPPLLDWQSLHLMDTWLTSINRAANMVAAITSPANAGFLRPETLSKVYSYLNGKRLLPILVASLAFKMALDSMMVQLPPVVANLLGSQTLFTAVAIGLAFYTVIAYIVDKVGDGGILLSAAAVVGVPIAITLGANVSIAAAFVPLYVSVYMLLGAFEVKSTALAMDADPRRLNFLLIATNIGAIMGDMIGGYILQTTGSTAKLTLFSASAFAIASLLWLKTRGKSQF